MSDSKQITVSQRLALGFGGPVALGILTAGVGAHEMPAPVGRLDHSASECLPKLARFARINDKLNAPAQSGSNLLIANTRTANETGLLTLGLAAAIGLLGGLMARWVTHSLSFALVAEPVALGAIARRVVAGDLGPVAGAALAPTGSLLAALGEMQAALARLVSQVRGASDAIATGSAQVVSGTVNTNTNTNTNTNAETACRANALARRGAGGAAALSSATPLRPVARALPKPPSPARPAQWPIRQPPHQPLPRSSGKPFGAPALTHAHGAPPNRFIEGDCHASHSS